MLKEMEEYIYMFVWLILSDKLASQADFKNHKLTLFAFNASVILSLAWVLFSTSIAA